jgi:PAS domain S-box-containing protein
VREQTHSFNAGQVAVLESVAMGAPLPQLLDDIVRFIEALADGMLCSILLVDDDGRIQHGAAPHLPVEFTRAIDGARIGPNAGSCGTAAYTGERVIVRDIATHPAWTHYRHLALPYGLRACWSSPIFAPNRDVLGTFAMYYLEIRSPTEKEIAWVDVATHLASIAILRDRGEQSLRRSEARAQQLARLYAVSNGVNEAIVRVRDPQSLYDFACRIAVEQGLAQLAWVGLRDGTGTRIEAVARHGTSASYVDAIDLDLADGRMNQGPAGRAIATGAPALCNDITKDPDFFWKQAAADRGLNSCAVFPLRAGDRIIGVFALYAEGAHYFRSEEVNVLTSLAADIGFAVESAGNEIDRQRMQATIRAGEHLRALVFENVADAIFYVAVEAPGRYRFLSVNRALLELSGLNESAVVGKLFEEVVPEESRQAVLEKYDQALSTCTKVSWDETYAYPSGLRQVEVTINPIVDAAGRCTHLVGTVHDTTARKQAEDERIRLEAQLHQARRLQSLGTLAGGIAHDFNNLIAAISGNADLALLEAAADTPLHEHLLEVRKASRRAAELVHQILTFSRREPPKRENLDLRAVIEEALRLLQATLPPNIEVKTRFATATPRISADSTQMHQVVMNLSGNAVRALGNNGGIIDVSLDSIEADAQSAPQTLKPGAHVRLRIADNGCGMEPAILQRAFDPFFTTRPPGEGTGLGLSVVHGVVESHGGAIEAHSEPGRGTTFTVYLPASTTEVQTSDPGEVVGGQGERILYLDDEESLVFLATRALTRLGYHVEGYSDPFSALEEFRAHPDAFDAVVTDLSMPRLSGPEFATALREIRPDIPIVMTSGYIRLEDVETARALRVEQLISKPSTIDELGRVVALEMQKLRERPAPSAPRFG